MAQSIEGYFFEQGLKALKKEFAPMKDVLSFGQFLQNKFGNNAIFPKGVDLFYERDNEVVEERLREWYFSNTHYSWLRKD